MIRASLLGMNDDAAGASNHFGGSFLARTNRGLARDNFGAIAGHGSAFSRRRIAGHNDRGRDPTHAGRQRQGLGVVARGMRYHAAPGLSLGERQDGIRSRRGLESPDL